MGRQPHNKGDAGKVAAALRRRHKAPAWAFLEQVADGTGAAKTRTVDALAMSLWPSRGLELHGFEIKTGRGDFLSEIKTPEKAESVYAYCNRWWLATTPGVVLDIGEVPPTWGWYEIRSGKVFTRREALALQAAPLDATFVAAVLRRATEGMVPKSSVASLVAAQLEEDAKEKERRDAQREHLATDQLKSLHRRVRDFEEASGVRIDNYDGEKVGPLVRAALDGGLGWRVRELRRARERLTECAKILSETLAELEYDGEAPPDA